MFLWLYHNAIRLVSIWDPKAKHWVQGRKKPLPTFNDPSIWMHCASLGEFEQGRPVLEALKKKYPQYKIVVSFYSPSGYLIRQNYSGADAVIYLPADSPSRAQDLIDHINPKLVLWVKYEYWYYHLTTIQKNNIPLLLISGIFRPSQPFFKWYGSMWRQMLSRFSAIFVQNEDSLELLKKHQLDQNAEVAGDTRFDRVADLLLTPKQLPAIETFCGQHNVIIAGSTWEEDEEVLAHFIQSHPELKFIIAPHEIDEDHLKDVEKLIPHAIRFSQYDGRPTEKNVLLIDNIGMLNQLYRFASISYVGGGFRDSGIHNTLEAAVYGKPVIFGPIYEKFREAAELIEYGAAHSIENALELEQRLDTLLENANLRVKEGNAAHEYVQRKKGATKKILDYIQLKRLLTN